MSKNGSNVEFKATWSIVGSENFDNTDDVYDILLGNNWEQFYSNHGQSGSNNTDTMVTSRNFWYPFTWRKLKAVRYRVRGTMSDGYWQEFTYSPELWIETPPQPKLELSAGTGTSEFIAKATIESDDYTHERYDTHIEITKYTRINGVSTMTVLKDTYITGTSYEESFNVSTTELALGDNDYINIVMIAQSRGLAGDSQMVMDTFVFAKPPKPELKSVTFTGDTVFASINTKQGQSFSDTSGGFLNPINQFYDMVNRPVTSVRLQRIKGAYMTAADIPVDASWSDVGENPDDGDSAGISEPFQDAKPSRGQKTWYRVKAWNNSQYRYSNYMELGWYEPNPEGGRTHIYSAKSGDDGTSAVIDVEWNTTGETGATSTATQVAWSDFEHAWESNNIPTPAEFTWEDSPSKAPDTTTSPSYDHSGRVYINGLEENKKYYFRARRAVTVDSTTTYGAWSSIVEMTPVSTPAWAVLSAPDAIARGKSLPLTWTFGSDQAQTAWRIFDTNGTIWASGEDALGSTTIPSEKLVGVSKLNLKVSLTTGGGWVESEAVTVSILEAPQVEVEVADTVTALPVRLNLTANDSGLMASISIISRGIAYSRPDGKKMQYAGDIVWTYTGTPTWEEGETSGEYVAEIEVDDTAFINGCTYDVEAAVTDKSSGLSSEVSKDSFAVSWSHAAGVPSATVTPNADKLTADILVIAPHDAISTDVCDVYRSTADGYYLIASGVEFGSTVTDRFAPFTSKLTNIKTSYRIACRTYDGDVVFNDIEYTLHSNGIRLDWATSSLTLPYNVEIGEGFSKDAEIRTHMDGTTNAYWNDGASHTMSLATELIRLKSAEERELVREVANYTGAVFVRLSNGIACDADVQIGEVSESYSSGAISVSLDCTGIELSDSHKCLLSDIFTPSHSGSVVVTA